MFVIICIVALFIVFFEKFPHRWLWNGMAGTWKPNEWPARSADGDLNL